ncbi:MAG: hypothetical protein ACFFCV_18845 [Promethearchaeota archaeon]
MFNIEDFKDNVIVEKVDKLNKYLKKSKIDKARKLIEEFQALLDQQENIVQITYILSIIAENQIELINERILKKIEKFLNSKNVKLKLNTLITIGFYLVAKPTLIEKNFSLLAKLLRDESEDVRNNVHYFMLELIKKNPKSVNSIIDFIFESLKIEKKSENIVSLLSYIDYCEDLEFDQLYEFRNILKLLIIAYDSKKVPKIFIK